MQGKQLDLQQKAKFLKRLLSSAGNVSKAARAAGIARNAAYDHKKSDEAFSDAWDTVIETVCDQAEEELFRRAVKGIKKPVFYKGQMVATVREFSDQLIMFYLKHKRKSFRDSLDLNVNIRELSDEELEAIAGS